MKADLRDKFDGMPLDKQRTLIRSMLETTVHPDRGTERVQIKHLVATALNDDADEYAYLQPEGDSWVSL